MDRYRVDVVIQLLNETPRASGAGRYVALMPTQRGKSRRGRNVDRTRGGEGSGDGQFRVPFGIDVGADGSVHVTDYENDRIQRFDPQGIFLSTWSSIDSTRRSGC